MTQSAGVAASDRTQPVEGATGEAAPATTAPDTQPARETVTEIRTETATARETATETATARETRTETATARETATETATARETRTETARETTTQTATVTAQPTRTPTPTPSSSPTAVEQPSGGVSAWLWVLAAAVIVGVVVAVVLVSRRRKDEQAWNQGMNAAAAEARWLAHDLLPAFEMQSSRTDRSALWGVSHGRVIGLEHALEALVAQSDDPANAQRASSLLTAVRRVRIAVDDAETMGDTAGEGARMLVVQSQRELVETLRSFDTRPMT